MDTVTPAKRSFVMSRVKGKDTKPELIVRRLVYHAGFRYRLCDPRLPGKPDLVFWGKRKAIFVHGCFWHGHKGCRRNRMPKSNQEYWFAKLERNKSRDSMRLSKLHEMGWRTLVVWECELKETDILLEKLKAFLIEDA
ncbi:very short patch repair endonuclease [Salmonella enterica]|uniref:Very short patch repair endonuclease n=1 Tax=Salmonella enterica I TaxID=59201 RepID=A0A3R1B5R9_SALET|nr:very short patch repair endonuclease [Salmonella enterica]ECJ8274502.1 DNA mismatch endonuclease Vsr [Salmonella enterica subsp. enterica]EEB7408754.1 DNA mismatch endonuclease Vsr [Salmonella enterica]EHT2683580.1 DNA mismatch endonuclease Vsr [Salmonella enterica]MML54838.1 DNA mismatch endonuclease Vsr [Salmonella enterica subsp. enterica serovar Kidderminster]